MIDAQYIWSKMELSQTLKLLLPKIKYFLRERLKKKGLVLDVGCGTGYLANWLGQNGYKTIGIDSSKAGIKLSRKNKNKNTFFICGDILQIKKKFHNKFDVVFCIEVIEHVFAPRDLLLALEKVVKKDGYVFISTPYHGYLKNLLIALLGKFDDHFTSLWDFGHIKFFSKKTLTKLINEKNFKIVSYGTVGRTFFLWKSMFFILKKI